MPRRVLAAMLALACAAPAAAQESGDGMEAVFAGVPDLTIATYPVSGSDAAEIRAAMAARGLRDGVDGTPVDARSDTSIGWQLQGDGRGGCDLENVRITFTASVILPRLIVEEIVPAPLRARWHAFAAALAEHEAGHLRAEYESVAAIRAAIAAGTCEGADAAAHAVIEATRRRVAEYDRVTEHGRLQGAVFP